MKEIFLPIYIMVPTSKAHLIATPKVPFHRHPYCVDFHFPFCSGLKMILIRGNSWISTKSTQLWVVLTSHMDGNTP